VFSGVPVDRVRSERQWNQLQLWQVAVRVTFSFNGATFVSPLAFIYTANTNISCCDHEAQIENKHISDSASFGVLIDLSSYYTKVWGSKPVRSEIIRTHLDRPWGSPSLVCKAYRVSFPRIKRPRSCFNHPPPSSKGKDKGFPLQAWSGSWGSRWLRLLDLLDFRHYEGGNVVTLTYRPSLPPRVFWYPFLEAESIPGHMVPSVASEKIPSDTTGYRSRHLLTSSAVP
jgi:hypothetical protein